MTSTNETTKSGMPTIRNFLKIMIHSTMVIVFIVGLLLCYGTRVHDQTEANGIDDLGSIQITISEVISTATGVVLRAKEYPTAFVFGDIYLPKSYVVPTKDDISTLLQVGTKVDLSVKKEAAADLNSYSNLHVYKLTLENGKTIFDGSPGALDYSKHFLKRFERVFQCMVVLPFVYFVAFFLFRKHAAKAKR